MHEQSSVGGMVTSKQEHKGFIGNIKKAAAIIGLIAVGAGLLPALPAPQADAAFRDLKSIDVMKLTKDVMANQPSDTEIDNLVSTLDGMNITHVALSIPMDATADYPAGSAPSPRTAEQFTQKWADAVHSRGLGVIWRGTYSGIEGIYNFEKRVGSNRFPTGTAASAMTDGTNTWLGKIYQYIVQHPTFFKDGDVWAPLPERTEGIFSDSTSFISSSPSLQENYVRFFNDVKTVSDQAFARIGKRPLTGMTANNYSEVMSTWLPQNFFDHNGVISIDYYGISHAPEEIESDMRKMYAMRGKPVFLQEWGDYWNSSMPEAERTAYLKRVYEVLQKLVNEGILMGFNYWGGWPNEGEGIITRSGSTYLPNYRGALLSNFYAANSVVGTPISTPPPTPTPTPSPQPAPAACPQAQSGTFMTCYFKDRYLQNVGAVTTETRIYHDWGHLSPAGIPQDNFSARWEGKFQFESGNYTFTVVADDGVRLWVDGQPIVDQWNDQPASTFTKTISLSAGTHTVKMEYYENGGGAVAKLTWDKASQTSTRWWFRWFGR